MGPLNFTPLITTPWADPSDLPQIRSIIYRLGLNAPPAEDRRQQAVDLLEAWKMRGDLPHAMDATCLLLNAITNASKPSVTHLSARSVYAVAWTRFVTGFCDLGKDARYRGLSMYKVAKDIGMPLHFVELRHEIGHEGLPSLQRLSKAAGEGMAWLWTHFWADMDIGGTTAIGKVSSRPSNLQDEIDAALAEFRRAHKDMLKGGKDTASTVSSRDSDTLASLSLLKLVKAHSAGLVMLVNSLVKISYLVPKNRQLGSSMDFTYRFWDMLLLQLASSFDTFAPLLLRQLTLTAFQPTLLTATLDPFREALREWIDHIFFSTTWHSIRVRHDEAMRGEALRICHGSTYPAAAELTGRIISAGANSLFKETQTRIFADADTTSSSDRPSKKRKL